MFTRSRSFTLRQKTKAFIAESPTSPYDVTLVMTLGEMTICRHPVWISQRLGTLLPTFQESGGGHRLPPARQCSVGVEAADKLACCTLLCICLPPELHCITVLLRMPADKRHVRTSRGEDGAAVG